jgi:putative transposase
MVIDRKHLRLSGWDYSSNGVYFITICCDRKQPYFGRIDNNKVELSEIGSIASQFWSEIPDHFPHVKIDEFVIMPNHLHGLLFLNHSWVGSRGCESILTGKNQIKESNQFSKPLKNSISVIINQYKSSVKRWCNQNTLEYFKWQTRFYDQVLRNDQSVDTIREYIFNNPKNWREDDL